MTNIFKYVYEGMMRIKKFNFNSKNNNLTNWENGVKLDSQQKLREQVSQMNNENNNRNNNQNNKNNNNKFDTEILQVITENSDVEGFTIAEYLPFDEHKLYKMFSKIKLFTD